MITFTIMHISLIIIMTCLSCSITMSCLTIEQNSCLPLDLSQVVDWVTLFYIWMTQTEYHQTHQNNVLMFLLPVLYQIFQATCPGNTAWLFYCSLVCVHATSSCSNHISDSIAVSDTQLLTVTQFVRIAKQHHAPCIHSVLIVQQQQSQLLRHLARTYTYAV